MKNIVCFGMTLYNNSKHLREAMDSLLGQTYQEFCIVALDDASTDETEIIMKDYIQRDKRISYFRNETREGMIHTWRAVFLKAKELHNPDLFAWASDHDRWHPEWLANHIPLLMDHPDTVLVYPETVYISSEGDVLPIESVSFETSDLCESERLFKICTQVFQAGNAVYGLFRSSSLEKAGIFRDVTMPDRLLLTEISLYGSMRYISKPLWYRRAKLPLPDFSETIRVQKNKLFKNENISLLADAPFLWHIISLTHFLLAENGNESSHTIFKEMLVFFYLQSHSDEIKDEIECLIEVLWLKAKESDLLNAEYSVWMESLIEHVSQKKNSLIKELSDQLVKKENEKQKILTLLQSRDKMMEDLKEAYRLNQLDSEIRLKNINKLRHQLETQKVFYDERVTRITQESTMLKQLLKERNDTVKDLKEAYSRNQIDSQKRLESINNLKSILELQQRNFKESNVKFSREKQSLEQLLNKRNDEIGQLREQFLFNQSDSEKRLERIKNLQTQLEQQKLNNKEKSHQFLQEKQSLEKELALRNSSIDQLKESFRQMKMDLENLKDHNRKLQMGLLEKQIKNDNISQQIKSLEIKISEKEEILSQIYKKPMKSAFIIHKDKLASFYKTKVTRKDNHLLE